MDMGLARAITTLTFKCGCIADDVVAPGNWTRRLGPACTVPAHYR
jgi:type 1 glutamine amidotransferase